MKIYRTWLIAITMSFASIAVADLCPDTERPPQPPPGPAFPLPDGG
jgi:hypothetical protein